MFLVTSKYDGFQIYWVRIGPQEAMLVVRDDSVDQAIRLNDMVNGMA